MEALGVGTALNSKSSASNPEQGRTAQDSGNLGLSIPGVGARCS